MQEFQPSVANAPFSSQGSPSSAMYKSQGIFSHFGTKLEVHIRIVHDTASHSTQRVLPITIMNPRGFWAYILSINAAQRPHLLLAMG
jgi:hypothetical protein